MASGTYTPGIEKERPGQYFNVHGTAKPVINAAARGVATVMLAGYDWGPTGMVEINGNAYDANKALLGRSVTDDNANMLLIREALKGAATVYAYINNTGTKATATIGNLVATAKYGGTRGNDIKVVIAARTIAPTTAFDLTVYLGTEKVTVMEAVATVGDVMGIDSPYVVFAPKSGEDEDSAIAVNAGTSLTGGTTPTNTNTMVTDGYLTAVETIGANAIAFPFTDQTLLAAAKAKVKYLREDMAQSVVIVCPNYDAADYEGVLNITNGYYLGDTAVSAAQATAWVAGVSAGATDLESNTYRVVEFATAVNGPLSHLQAVAADKSGKMFFDVSETGDIVLEYDVNTLVTYTATKPRTYRKNKIIRVIDSIKDMIKGSYRPNQFTNDERGWAMMESIGRSILEYFFNRGSIQNVDYDNDFKVDRSLSSGESTYFNVAVQPVDAAEKLYFDIATS